MHVSAGESKQHRALSFLLHADELLNIFYLYCITKGVPTVYVKIVINTSINSKKMLHTHLF